MKAGGSYARHVPTVIDCIDARKLCSKSYYSIKNKRIDLSRPTDNFVGNRHVDYCESLWFSARPFSNQNAMAGLAEPCLWRWISACFFK